jgi:hypothetical protein
MLRSSILAAAMAAGIIAGGCKPAGAFRFPACDGPTATLADGSTVVVRYCRPGVPLYVCCGAGDEGCAGLENASDCPAGWLLYECEAGQSTVGDDGKPGVICHD